MNQQSPSKAEERNPSNQISAELYQSLFDQAPDGILFANAHGDFIEVNHQACTMLGYAREEIVHRSILDLFPATDQAGDPFQLDQAQPGARTVIERQVFGKNGRIIPVEISVRKLEDSTILCIMREIGSRSPAKPELHHTQQPSPKDPIAVKGPDRQENLEVQFQRTAEELQRVISSVSDILWSGALDEEGNWTYSYYSPVVETITGRPPEFYMENPQRWLGIVHPEDQIRLSSSFQRVMSGGSTREEEEYRIVRPDGTIRWVRDCATVTILGSQRLRIDGIVSDITERKQAEKELQKSHELLRAFFSQSTNGCFFMMLDQPVHWNEAINKEEVLDYIFAHQRLTDLNDAMLSQYAATREQMLNLTPNDFFQHDLVHGRSFWRQLLDTGKLRLESDERRMDGTQMWVEGEYILLSDDEGRVTGHFGIQRDITHRRRAAEKLSESNKRFQLLAESVLTGVYLIQDGLFRYANPAITKMFGYETEEFIDKLGPLDIVIPEDRALVAENLRRRIEGEVEEIHYEIRGLRKDGSTIFVEVHGRRIEYDGKVGVLGTLLDITERRQTEAELKRNRETALKFSEMLATLQTVTNQLSIIKTSEELCRQAVQLGHLHLGFDRLGIWFIKEDQSTLQGSFGVDEQGNLRDERDVQVSLKRDSMAWHIFAQKQSIALSEHRPLFNHLSQKVGEGENAMAALWDGTEIIGIISVDNLLTQKPITNYQLEVLRLYASTLGHLIRRTWVEDALRASEARFRTFVEHAADAVFLHDAQGIILDVNQQACESLGYTREELIGMTPLDFEAEKDLAFLEQFEARLDAGELIAFDTYHRRKDGTVFPTEVRVRPFWQGGQRFAISLARDNTEKLDTQIRVQRQERLAAVGHLAAGIAHDFNNILAVIRLYAQLIPRTVNLPTRAQERLQTIEQQTQRATDLIQQILDFSRQSVLERRPLNLLPFIDELILLLNRTLPEHVEVKLAHDAEAYFIQADPSRIQQAMMNLAANARDAMPEGGKLQIKLEYLQTLEPIPMTVQELPSGNWIKIEVTDSGEGIPPEALDHIFEPFFTTKAVGEGTGLGLAQVYGIVQQHEGFIDVMTEAGQGTSFSIYFPALSTEDSALASRKKSALRLGQGQRILVVEDDQATREALLDSLAQMNYEVSTATNGREALTILLSKAAEIDLVLSDVVMPEMGGNALFQAIREHGLTVPVVLLTGHPLGKEMENLQTLGLDGWLSKPPDLVSLSNLLADVLQI